MKEKNLKKTCFDEDDGLTEEGGKVLLEIDLALNKTLQSLRDRGYSWRELENLANNAVSCISLMGIMKDKFEKNNVK